MSTAAPIIAPIRGPRVRQVALPTEHGGWAFLLEPIVTGIAIAYTSGALWVALLMIGAFLTRQPLKVLIADRFAVTTNERAILAMRFVLVYSVVFFAGLVGTLAAAGVRPLIPFAIVLPLGVYQVYIDSVRQSRKLLPELTGAVAMSSSIAAIALAGDLPLPNVIALWALFASRSIASILYVRQRLRLEKGKKYSRAAPVVSHVAVLLLTAVLAKYSLSGTLTVIVMSALAFRAISGLSPNRRKLKAMQIGILEVVYGAIFVLSVVVGYYS